MKPNIKKMKGSCLCYGIRNGLLSKHNLVSKNIQKRFTLGVSQSNLRGLNYFERVKVRTNVTVQMATKPINMNMNIEQKL